MCLQSTWLPSQRQNMAGSLIFLCTLVPLPPTHQGVMSPGNAGHTVGLCYSSGALCLIYQEIPSYRRAACIPAQPFTGRETLILVISIRRQIILLYHKKMLSLPWKGSLKLKMVGEVQKCYGELC
jgi:hypothetical protein